MQFTLNQIGQKINVLFNALLFDTIKFKLPVIESFETSFERIGGERQDDGTWNFPIFVSSQIIQEIIDNTCFVCGGLMKNSTAYKNEDLYQPTDYGKTKIFIDAGKAKQIKVRKCTQCGHSHA